KAAARPVPSGSDSSTTVKPLSPAGQAVRLPRGRAAVVAGGGAVGVTGGPVDVGVSAGSVTVAVCACVVGVWAAPPCVATSVLFSAPASVRTIAAVAPAIAITSPSSTRQIQSPGYQPKRACQAAARRPMTPRA